MPVQINPDEWYRSGGGLGCEFDMESSEIQNVFEKHLPASDAGYDFVLFDPIWEGRRVTGKSTTILQLNDLASEILKREGENKNVQIYLRIQAVHGSLDWSKLKYPDAFCSLNGFPLFQSSLRGWGSGCKNSFELVWKVRNYQTSEEIEHLEARRVYETVRRHFLKQNGPLGGTGS